MDKNKINKILSDFKEDIEKELGYEINIKEVKRDIFYETAREVRSGIDRSPCMKVTKFNFKIPDCRVFAEVYKMHNSNIPALEFADKLHREYENEYKKTKQDIEKKMVSRSSIEGYIFCKNCNPKDDKAPSIKRPILKDVLCGFIPFPIKPKDIFDLNTMDTSKLIEVLTPSSREDFHPLFEKKEREKMNQKEKDKLYEVVYVTKNEYELNLKDKEKTDGSAEYKYNLALYAFERNLPKAALRIIDEIKDSDIKMYDEYHQLHAKILSMLDRDKDAIEVLEGLIKKQKTTKIDPESYNLLSASIKRKAFQDYLNNEISDSEFYIEIKKAKNNYSNIYNITKEYYPAINIIYLLMMMAKFENKNKIGLEIVKKEVMDIWDNSNIQEELTKKDWWSYISNIEYLILIEKYEEALEKLNNYKKELDEKNISDFNIFSTIRQMKKFYDVTQNNEVKKIIGELEKIQENKESLEYFNEL